MVLDSPTLTELDDAVRVHAAAVEYGEQGGECETGGSRHADGVVGGDEVDQGDRNTG